MIKDLVRIIRVKLRVKFDYFSNIQPLKIAGIVTDNSIPRHTRFLGISYNFEHLYTTQTQHNEN